VDSALATLIRVLHALERVAATSLVWPEGLLNPGGPHRRLDGHLYPISIGDDECLVFGKLIEALRPQHCFIIGNAFGLSSAYIACMMRDHGGRSVTTLDDRSEGEGVLIAEVAQSLAGQLQLDSILENVHGRAPGDIPVAAKQPSYQLIFVDGLHRHPQVTRDFRGMLPYCAADTVIVFHDSWIIGVPEAVREAKERGMYCWWVPTSCEMILVTAKRSLFAELQRLFPQGVEDRGRRSYLYGYLLHLREVASFWIGRLSRSLHRRRRERATTRSPRP